VIFIIIYFDWREEKKKQRRGDGEMERSWKPKAGKELLMNK
jgi:hypothetical protein